jgi:hypothetical protein
MALGRYIPSAQVQNSIDISAWNSRDLRSPYEHCGRANIGGLSSAAEKNETLT